MDQPQPPTPPVRRARGAAGRQQRSRIRSRHNRRTQGSTWILCLAVVSLAWALFSFYVLEQNRKVLDAKLAREWQLEEYEQEDGQVLTVAAIREKMKQEVLLVSVINGGFTAAMFGLYFWSKRSPLPAMITALGLFLAVNVLLAIVYPPSILTWIVLKVLFVAAMIAGIRASLPDGARPEPA